MIDEQKITKEQRKKIEAGQQLLEEIQKQGYEAYFVGGFVRDILLQRFFLLDDIDIATSMPINELRALFEISYEAERYAMACVIFQTCEFEVTHYRKDGESLNHRHLKAIELADTLKEDVKRRDFTINGLAMDQTFQIIDFVEGRIDLQNQVIKAIGDPKRRFREDSLRLLRALRFASDLSFVLEENTAKAFIEQLPLIQNLTVDRIRQEFKKVKQLPKFIQMLIDFDVPYHHPALEATCAIPKRSIEYIQSWDDFIFLQLFWSSNRARTFESLHIGKKQIRIYNRLFEYIEDFQKNGQTAYWNYKLGGDVTVFKFLALIDETPYNEYITHYQQQTIKQWSDIDFGLDALKQVPKDTLHKIQTVIACDILDSKVGNSEVEIAKYLKEVYGWE